MSVVKSLRSNMDRITEQHLSNASNHTSTPPPITPPPHTFRSNPPPPRTDSTPTMAPRKSATPQPSTPKPASTPKAPSHSSTPSQSTPKPSSKTTIPSNPSIRNPQDIQQIAVGVYNNYIDRTPQRVKLLDAFLLFLGVVGALQFIYCVVAGNYVCTTTIRWVEMGDLRIIVS